MVKLRENPNLGQLKRQAKELLRAFREARPDALVLVNQQYHGASASKFALHDAQLVIARAYGFESWPKLKANVDGVTARRLAEFVRIGDIESVQAMLEARPELVDIQMGENDEHRALHYAVLGRMPDMVRLLMHYGADARKGIWPNRDATSALTIAEERGYDEIAAIIGEEERRRPPKVESPVRVTAPAQPIREAVLESRVDEVLRLLKAGADPDERFRFNDSEPAAWSSGGPLHLCAASGNVEIARILLEHGADANAEVYASGSVLFRAYASSDREMIDLIESYGGFLDAASAGFLGQTELARQMFADESAGRLREGTVPEGSTLAETLLWSGCGGGDPEIVRMALDRIDWPRDDRRWHWPLWQALTSERPDPAGGLACFQSVLDRADSNVSTFARTILHDVVASGKNVIAEERVLFAALLLEAGARLDLRDDLLRSTPLGWACRWGHLKMVKFLLDCGAEPVEADAEPWAMPSAWAKKMKHSAIQALLSDRTQT